MSYAHRGSIFRGLYRLWRATTGNWEVQTGAPLKREKLYLMMLHRGKLRINPLEG